MLKNVLIYIAVKASAGMKPKLTTDGGIHDLFRYFSAKIIIILINMRNLSEYIRLHGNFSNLKPTVMNFLADWMY